MAIKGLVTISVNKDIWELFQKMYPRKASALINDFVEGLVLGEGTESDSGLNSLKETYNNQQKAFMEHKILMDKTKMKIDALEKEREQRTLKEQEENKFKSELFEQKMQDYMQSYMIMTSYDQYKIKLEADKNGFDTVEKYYQFKVKQELSEVGGTL